MISITGDMQEKIDNALVDRAPCFVGTASKGGKPQISMKGSVLVYDDETLAYWERAKRSALTNVQDNPQTIIFYRNGQSASTDASTAPRRSTSPERYATT